MSSTTDHQADVARLEAEAARAEAAAADARRQRDVARTAAERERQARRTAVWRRQLQNAERHDWPGEIARARTALATAVRGQGPTGPVTALYRLLLAEGRRDAAQVLAAGLRGQLGLPTPEHEGRPRYQGSALDALAQVLMSEVARQLAADAELRDSQASAVWQADDLPTAPARLDPVRASELRSRVERLRGAIADQEVAVSQVPKDGLTAGQREAAEAVKADLASLRRRLTTAEAEWAAFESGLSA